MRLMLFSGKGGVGKTSLSAAQALRLAAEGKRTLVVSTDAAHSLGDVLGRKLGHTPSPVADGLWAQEIDVRESLRRHWERIRKYLTEVLRSQGVSQLLAEEIVRVPGVEETVSLLEIRRHLDDYDSVVVDCAPTAGALKLLSLPEAMQWYMTRFFPVERKLIGLLKPLAERMVPIPLPGDDVFAQVDDLYGEIVGLKEFLETPERACAALVTTPDRVVHAEAARAFSYFAFYGIRVAQVLVNKVFQPEMRASALGQWVDHQQALIGEIRSTFSPVPVIEVPFTSVEPVGLEALERLAQLLPAAFDRGAAADPMRFAETPGAYELSIHLPNADAAAVDMWRRDDTLILSYNNVHRSVVLPDSLAQSTVLDATYANHYLTVRFRK